jgi:hypothetical protein
VPISRINNLAYWDRLLVSATQNGNPLQQLTRNLHGLNLYIVANAELVDGDQLIAAFQPGPRLNGEPDLPSAARLRQGWGRQM